MNLGRTIIPSVRFPPGDAGNGSSLIASEPAASWVRAELNGRLRTGIQAAAKIFVRRGG
jgi:hypothetical protein